MTSTDSCKNLKSLLVLTLLSVAVLLFPVTANAKNCLKLHDKNSPSVIVSGRITTHHKLPKDSEQRTGDGPWLILDQPLLADHTMASPTDPPKLCVLLQMAENRHPARRRTVEGRSRSANRSNQKMG